MRRSCRPLAQAPGIARPGTLRALTAASALALLLVAGGLVQPASVAAAAGRTDTAASTYTLNPAAGRIDVSIAAVVRNTKADTATVRYFLTDTLVVLEREARSISATADTGRATLTKVESVSGFDVYRVTFSPLFSGQTRSLAITYQLPGGAPRSSSAVRAGRAYASFCAVSNGVDSGSVAVVVPSSFAFEWTGATGVRLTTTKSGATTRYQSGTLAEPTDFWACFSGSDPTAYTTQTITAPSGRLIRLQAWPEDGTWLNLARDDVGEAVEELEAAVGRGIPGSGPIVVREVGDASLGPYAAFFDPKGGIAYVSEDVQQGVIAHELAHSWFNDSLFDARWLSEGSAEWARVEVVGDPCGDPGAAPGGAKAQLGSWKFAGPRATVADLALIGYQYRAACFVVTNLADKAGDERMKTVLGTLIDGKIAYQSNGSSIQRHAGAATWRDWLDAIDELGIVPAGGTGLDYAQGMLERFGVISATDAALLAQRAEARARYHELRLAVHDEYALPEAILRAMAEWRYPEATRSVASASTAWKAVTESAQLLPEAKAVAGPIKARFEAARSSEELAAVARLAVEQRTAAELVAAAKAHATGPRVEVARLGLTGKDLTEPLAEAVAAVTAADLERAKTAAAAIDKVLADEAAAATAMAKAKVRLDAPRDPLMSIGLLGTDLDGAFASGVAAVSAVDAAGATAAAAAIEASLAGASEQGVMRLALTLALLSVVLMVVYLRLKRGVGPGGLQAAAAATGTSMAPGAPGAATAGGRTDPAMAAGAPPASMAAGAPPASMAPGAAAPAMAPGAAGPAMAAVSGGLSAADSPATPSEGADPGTSAPDPAPPGPMLAPPPPSPEPAPGDSA